MIGPDVPDDDPVRERWDDVIADVEATARRYEARGWTAVALHPGDVTPLVGTDDGRRGFDVLLPDNEFERLCDLIDGGATFEAADVYATSEDGVVFLGILMRDGATESAVSFPMYYRRQSDPLSELREQAETTGSVETHLRPLDEDRIVTFVHDDPSLFFPDG